MAADSRQFVDHFELDGSSVYNEDKRLGELKDATAVTSISTSSQYVALQDTDGNLVKINPASFQEAVRNTLAGLLANNDKGTTISGIPALSGSGSSIDFGSITAANLASVLGAQLHIYTVDCSVSAGVDTEINVGTGNGLILFYFSSTGPGGLYHYTYWNAEVTKLAAYNESAYTISKTSSSGKITINYSSNGTLKVFYIRL